MTVRECALAILKLLWDEPRGERSFRLVSDFAGYADAFEIAMRWLVSRGLIIKVRVMHPNPSLDHWRYFAANQVRTRKVA